MLGMLRYQERAPLLCNRWLVVAVAVSLCLQLLLIYSPVGVLFGVVPLGLIPWLILMVGLVVGYVAALWISDFVVLLDDNFATIVAAISSGVLPFFFNTTPRVAHSSSRSGVPVNAPL